MVDEPIRTEPRARCLAGIARRILRLAPPHPTRVAIDGPDAAGKTVLADELAEELAASGRQVIRASIDGFHRPRTERYRLGAYSPAGYFRDSFDYAALRSALLDPLGPGGSLTVRRRVFDSTTDLAIQSEAQTAAPDSILVFDGVFLLRAELRDCWDYSVFVDVSFVETMRRALARDLPLFGSPAEIERRYEKRYIPGQRLYFRLERPRDRADALVENEDWRVPNVRYRAEARPTRGVQRRQLDSGNAG
jgi:uridine kinase